MTFTSHKDNMTATIVSEAEKFCNRVSQEFPTIIQDEPFLRAVVQECRNLGLYSNGCNAQNYWAAFLSAKSNGTIQVPPTAQELAAQKQAQEDKERIEKYWKQVYSNPRKTHAQVEREENQGIKNLRDRVSQHEAERQCKTLVAYRHDGRVDHVRTQQLQKVFETDSTGQIDWVQTWAARQMLIRNHDKKTHEQFNSR